MTDNNDMNGQAQGNTVPQGQPQGGQVQGNQSNEINDLKKQIAELSAMLKNGNGQQKQDNNDINKSLQMTAREKEELEKAKQTEGAIKFNLGIEKFVADNKKILPDNTENLLKVINNNVYSNEREKEKAIKLQMFNNFFQYQDNVNMIKNSEDKAKLEEFKKLSDTEKLNRVAGYYSIFENALINKQYEEKAKQIALGNKGFADNDSPVSQYNKKFFEKAREVYFRK